MTLVLRLMNIPADKTIGCYDGNRNGKVDDPLPARMRFVHPSAASDFLVIAPYVVVSDLFRSPESSLAAVRAGRGAKAPGFSAHNFGLAVDIDVGAAMKKTRLKTKRDLDGWLSDNGWWCHRVDHQITPLKGESHHYNYLGRDFVLPPGAKSTAPSIEARIVALYGNDFLLCAKDLQWALRTLRLYAGEIDGDAGPLTREAVRAFQRTWNLPDTGKADAKTQRTLAYITSASEIVAA